MKRPRGQVPLQLGLEPRLAICLAQLTARSYAARNSVRYRNHSLDGATLLYITLFHLLNGSIKRCKNTLINITQQKERKQEENKNLG